MEAGMTAKPGQRCWLWLLKIKAHTEGKFPTDLNDVQVLFYAHRGNHKIPEKAMRFQVSVQDMLNSWKRSQGLTMGITCMRQRWRPEGPTLDPQ